MTDAREEGAHGLPPTEEPAGAASGSGDGGKRPGAALSGSAAARPAGRVPAPPPGPVDELRAIFVTPEREALARLRERLDDPDLRADEVSRVVVEALKLAGARGPELARTLLPELDRMLAYAVARDPRALGLVLERPIELAQAHGAERRRVARFDALERSFSPRALRLRLGAFLSRRRFRDLLDESDLVYRVEHVLLLHAVTGTVLAEVSAPHVSARDRELVGRALGPVQSFLRTAAPGQAVNVVRVEDRSVFLEVAEHATLAAIVRGTPPPDLPARLAFTLEATAATWRAELARLATGGPVPPALHGVLEGCLSEQWRSDPGRRRRFARTVVIVLALLAAGAVAARVYTHVRFTRAVAAVEALPGVTVTSAVHRVVGRDRIAGLRDPLARDPAKALAISGVEPAATDLQFEPFVSLEPAIVVERATRALEPPPEVALSYTGGRIKAKGVAPHAWIVAARERARAVPGATGLDEEELVDGGIEQMAMLASALEERAITFAPGSSAIAAGEVATLRDIVTQLQRLLAAARQVRQRPRVVVVGIPPGPGPGATALASDRAAHVVTNLVALGADPAILGSRAGRPATAPAAGAPERAITFDVRLEDVPEPAPE